MKNFQNLLSEDRGSLTARLKGCTEDKAVQILKDEISRLLSLYNEQDLPEEVRHGAQGEMAELQAALPFITCHKDPSIFHHYKEEESSGRKHTVFLMSGCLLAGASSVILLMCAEKIGRFVLAGILCSALAMICFYLSGSTGKKHLQDQEEITTAADEEKIYHVLLACMVTSDRHLDEIMRSCEEAERRDALAEKEKGESQEIRLMSRLLESVYADPDSDTSKEILSEIRYALHREKVDIVEDVSSHPEWFDRIPGSGGIVRPALARGGIVLARGLAAGGGR